MKATADVKSISEKREKTITTGLLFSLTTQIGLLIYLAVQANFILTNDLTPQSGLHWLLCTCAVGYYTTHLKANKKNIIS